MFGFLFLWVLRMHPSALCMLSTTTGLHPWPLLEFLIIPNILPFLTFFLFSPYFNKLNSKSTGPVTCSTLINLSFPCVSFKNTMPKHDQAENSGMLPDSKTIDTHPKFPCLFPPPRPATSKKALPTLPSSITYISSIRKQAPWGKELSFSFLRGWAQGLRKSLWMKWTVPIE